MIWYIATQNLSIIHFREAFTTVSVHVVFAKLSPSFREIIQHHPGNMFAKGYSEYRKRLAINSTYIKLVPTSSYNGYNRNLSDPSQI